MAMGRGRLVRIHDDKDINRVEAGNRFWIFANPVTRARVKLCYRARSCRFLRGTWMTEIQPKDLP